MTHELIKLPYANNALEPVISAETIQYHHGKHLKGYVDTLNKLLPDSDLKDASLEEIVRKAEGKLYNQAGQVMNHNMYFLQFAPNAASSLTLSSATSVALKLSRQPSTMPAPHSLVQAGLG